MVKTPLFIMVGGFLGAGKTTTVGRLARHFQGQGKRVVVVEDVTTTGGSAMKALAELRREGAEVVRVVTVVDRDEGATEFFAKEKLPFTAILEMDAFR